METPSSTREATRSEQALLVSDAEEKMREDTEKTLPSHSKSLREEKERSGLHDITNDSPIVGVATLGGKSRGWRWRRAPGSDSGEALLRGQVKILLRKVEEEEIEKSETFQALLGHLRSPRTLLAPTPANTPRVTCSSTGVDFRENQASEIPRVEEEILDLRRCLINRTLFDSPEKTCISDSSTDSTLTFQGSSTQQGIADDCSSAWSIEGNAGSQRESEKEEVIQEEFLYDGFYDLEKEVEEEERGDLYALCERLRTMAVREKGGLPGFTGKHSRFVYNSDDEIEGEEEVVGAAAVVPPGILRLRGLPAPEGKHLRFHEEGDEN